MFKRHKNLSFFFFTPKNNKYYTFEEVFLISFYNLVDYKDVALLKSLHLLCENNIEEYEGFLSFSKGVDIKYILTSCVNNMPKYN
jgi:hypothetical protein